MSRDISNTEARAVLKALNYTPYTAWSAEGERIGMATCLRCGAAIMVAAGVDSAEIHDKWHAATLPIGETPQVSDG